MTSLQGNGVNLLLQIRKLEALGSNSLKVMQPVVELYHPTSGLNPGRCQFLHPPGLGTCISLCLEHFSLSLPRECLLIPAVSA